MNTTSSVRRSSTQHHPRQNHSRTPSPRRTIEQQKSESSRATVKQPDKSFQGILSPSGSGEISSSLKQLTGLPPYPANASMLAALNSTSSGSSKPPKTIGLSSGQNSSLMEKLGKKSTLKKFSLSMGHKGSSSVNHDQSGMSDSDNKVSALKKSALTQISSSSILGDVDKSIALVAPPNATARKTSLTGSPDTAKKLKFKPTSAAVASSTMGPPQPPKSSLRGSSSSHRNSKQETSPTDDNKRPATEKVHDSPLSGTNLKLFVRDISASLRAGSLERQSKRASNNSTKRNNSNEASQSISKSVQLRLTSPGTAGVSASFEGGTKDPSFEIPCKSLSNDCGSPTSPSMLKIGELPKTRRKSSVVSVMHNSPKSNSDGTRPASECQGKSSCEMVPQLVSEKGLVVKQYNVPTVGTLLPTIKILLKGTKVTLREFFSDKRGVLFGGPGAFTPASSERQLIGFRDQTPRLQQSLDFIGCIFTNDPYVLKAWAKSKHIHDEITFISDVDERLTTALGVRSSTRTRGLGYRARPFAMVVARGGAIEWIGFDDESFAEDVLEYLHLTPLPPLISMSSAEGNDAESIGGPTKSIDPVLSARGNEGATEHVGSAEDRKDPWFRCLRTEEAERARWRSGVLSASVRREDLSILPSVGVVTRGSGYDLDTVQMDFNLIPPNYTILTTESRLQVECDEESSLLGRVKIGNKIYAATHFHFSAPGSHIISDPAKPAVGYKPVTDVDTVVNNMLSRCSEAIDANDTDTYRPPIEIRIVCELISGSQRAHPLVIACPFEIPDSDDAIFGHPFIDSVLSIPTLSPGTWEVFSFGKRSLASGGLNLGSLFTARSTFYRYENVLSAYGEKVMWLVLREALPVSVSQLSQLLRYLTDSGNRITRLRDFYPLALTASYSPKFRNFATPALACSSLSEKLIFFKLYSTVAFESFTHALLARGYGPTRPKTHSKTPIPGSESRNPGSSSALRLKDQGSSDVISNRSMVDVINTSGPMSEQLSKEDIIVLFALRKFLKKLGVELLNMAELASRVIECCDEDGHTAIKEVVEEFRQAAGECSCKVLKQLINFNDQRVKGTFILSDDEAEDDSFTCRMMQSTGDGDTVFLPQNQKTSRIICSSKDDTLDGPTKQSKSSSTAASSKPSAASSSANSPTLLRYSSTGQSLDIESVDRKPPTSLAKRLSASGGKGLSYARTRVYSESNRLKSFASSQSNTSMDGTETQTLRVTNHQKSCFHHAATVTGKAGQVGFSSDSSIRNEESASSRRSEAFRLLEASEDHHFGPGESSEDSGDWSAPPDVASDDLDKSAQEGDLSSSVSTKEDSSSSSDTNRFSISLSNQKSKGSFRGKGTSLTRLKKKGAMIANSIVANSRTLKKEHSDRIISNHRRHDSTPTPALNKNKKVRARSKSKSQGYRSSETSSSSESDVVVYRSKSDIPMKSILSGSRGSGIKSTASTGSTRSHSSSLQSKQSLKSNENPGISSSSSVSTAISSSSSILVTNRSKKAMRTASSYSANEDMNSKPSTSSRLRFRDDSSGGSSSKLPRVSSRKAGATAPTGSNVMCANCMAEEAKVMSSQIIVMRKKMSLVTPKLKGCLKSQSKVTATKNLKFSNPLVMRRLSQTPTSSSSSPETSAASSSSSSAEESSTSSQSEGETSATSTSTEPSSSSGSSDASDEDQLESSLSESESGSSADNSAAAESSSNSSENGGSVDSDESTVESVASVEVKAKPVITKAAQMKHVSEWDEDRINLVEFMIRQLKRSTSGESVDDLTTANTQLNMKPVEMSSFEINNEKKKKKKKTTRPKGMVAFATTPIVDVEWGEADRQFNRNLRLSCRRPTGHPNLKQQVSKLLSKLSAGSGEVAANVPSKPPPIKKSAKTTSTGSRAVNSKPALKPCIRDTGTPAKKGNPRSGKAPPRKPPRGPSGITTIMEPLSSSESDGSSTASSATEEDPVSISPKSISTGSSWTTATERSSLSVEYAVSSEGETDSSEEQQSTEETSNETSEESVTSEEVASSSEEEETTSSDASKSESGSSVLSDMEDGESSTTTGSSRSPSPRLPLKSCLKRSSQEEESSRSKRTKKSLQSSSPHRHGAPPKPPPVKAKPSAAQPSKKKIGAKPSLSAKSFSFGSSESSTSIHTYKETVSSKKRVSDSASALAASRSGFYGREVSTLDTAFDDDSSYGFSSGSSEESPSRSKKPQRKAWDVVAKALAEMNMDSSPMFDSPTVVGAQGDRPKRTNSNVLQNSTSGQAAQLMASVSAGSDMNRSWMDSSQTTIDDNRRESLVIPTDEDDDELPADLVARLLNAHKARGYSDSLLPDSESRHLEGLSEDESSVSSLGESTKSSFVFSSSEDAETPNTSSETSEEVSTCGADSVLLSSSSDLSAACDTSISKDQTFASSDSRSDLPLSDTGGTRAQRQRTHSSPIPAGLTTDGASRKSKSFSISSASVNKTSGGASGSATDRDFRPKKEGIHKGSHWTHSDEDHPSYTTPHKKPRKGVPVNSNSSDEEGVLTDTSPRESYYSGGHIMPVRRRSECTPKDPESDLISKRGRSTRARCKAKPRSSASTPAPPAKLSPKQRPPPKRKVVPTVAKCRSNNGLEAKSDLVLEYQSSPARSSDILMEASPHKRKKLSALNSSAALTSSSSGGKLSSSLRGQSGESWGNPILNLSSPPTVPEKESSTTVGSHNMLSAGFDANINNSSNELILPLSSKQRLSSSGAVLREDALMSARVEIEEAKAELARVSSAITPTQETSQESSSSGEEKTQCSPKSTEAKRNAFNRERTRHASMKTPGKGSHIAIEELTAKLGIL